MCLISFAKKVLVLLCQPCIFFVKFTITGSRSTFEFPSRVNFSGPSLHCIARTLGKWSRHSIGIAGATKLTRSDFRLNLLLLKGERCVLYLYREHLPFRRQKDCYCDARRVLLMVEKLHCHSIEISRILTREMGHFGG